MSLPVSPPTQIHSDSTMSTSPEPATTTSIQRTLIPQAWTPKAPVAATNSLTGFLKAIVLSFAYLLRLFFSSFVSSPDAILSKSPNDDLGAESGDEQPLSEPIAASSVDGSEDRRPSSEPIPAPSVAEKAGHPKRDPILDGDDPADEDYIPPSDADCEPLDVDKPYEDGSHRLEKAGRDIAEQQQGSIISRVRSMRWREEKA